MRPTVGLFLALASGFSASACVTSVEVPDGVFACATADDCPEAFECRTDGLCYAAPDGGPSDASEGGTSADGGG
jgi:hypothetical protein